MPRVVEYLGYEIAVSGFYVEGAKFWQGVAHISDENGAQVYTAQTLARHAEEADAERTAEIVARNWIGERR